MRKQSIAGLLSKAGEGGYQRSRGGATSLISPLYCDHTAFKKLDLSSTNIAEEDCDLLAQLLCSGQYLESLLVSDNCLSSDSVHILFRGLQQIPL